MDEAYCDHEAFVLSWIIFIRCVECVRFLIFDNLRVVPRHQVLKLDEGEQEEDVVNDEGDESTEVRLYGCLAFAVEVR